MGTPLATNVYEQSYIDLRNIRSIILQINWQAEWTYAVFQKHFMQTWPFCSYTSHLFETYKLDDKTN